MLAAAHSLVGQVPQPDSAMDQLAIRLFGSLEVRRDGVLLPAFPTQGSAGLFAYLVLKRERLVHRDVLCGEFWGDQSEAEARKALRTALWRIRTVVEPGKKERGMCVRAEGHHVGLARREGIWVDVWEFEDCLSPQRANGLFGVNDPEPERLERATHLFRGDFLEGYYTEWCEMSRERLRLAYLRALERLVALHHTRGEWLEAIMHGRQLLDVDPLREHIHRAVMSAHLAMGDRPSALRQFGTCVRVLRDELNITPMEETYKLSERIRDGSGAGSPGPEWRRAGLEDAASLVAAVDGALADLRDLTRRLEYARHTLPTDER